MDHSFTEKYPILNQMQNWPNACEIRITLYVTSWYTVMQIEWFWWSFGGKGCYPEICHLGPLYWYRLTLIPAWMNNDIYQTVWDEINYPFPNFNGAAREWMGNFIPHLLCVLLLIHAWIKATKFLKACRWEPWSPVFVNEKHEWALSVEWYSYS